MCIFIGQILDGGVKRPRMFERCWGMLRIGAGGLID